MTSRPVPLQSLSSASPPRYVGFSRDGRTTPRGKKLLPTRRPTSIDTYALTTRYNCVLNLVNRHRCKRTVTASMLSSRAMRPDEF